MIDGLDKKITFSQVRETPPGRLHRFAAFEIIG
jgi:hypothetical protein